MSTLFLLVHDNMHGQQKSKSNLIRRRLLIVAIGCVLLSIFCFPAMLLFSSAAGAIGGLAIICDLVLLQLPIFMLMKKARWLPDTDQRVPNDQIEPDVE